MPDPFKFELVSPERLLMSDEVRQVTIPGTEGDFTVLAGHAPLISALRPGILEIRHRTCQSGQSKTTCKSIGALNEKTHYWKHAFAYGDSTQTRLMYFLEFVWEKKANNVQEGDLYHITSHYLYSSDSFYRLRPFSTGTRERIGTTNVNAEFRRPIFHYNGLIHAQTQYFISSTSAGVMPMTTWPGCRSKAVSCIDC